ncbi:hypothetical protein Tco_0465412 [Tanacetum coccineum]
MGRCRDEIASGTDGPYLGSERDRVVADLSQPEKDRLRADIRATNILLQGLPRDIYKLINHNTDAKDIWDNVKMLLEGSELTKDDRKSQLYDEFEHFGQHKGENIHDYYVKFTKLINDMRHIKMTMPKIQLNFKLVNNMLPEWGRFVMAVKLNRGLKESNHDQLYAYLKQHEGRQNRVQGNNVRGVVATGNGGAQNRAGNANAGQGKPIKCYHCNGIGDTARNYNQPKRLQNSDYFKEKMLLMQNEVNIFQADQCDAFDFDVDEAPTAQTMFMANLSSADSVYNEAGPSYDSDNISEVHNHDNYLDNMNEYHEEHEMQNDVQPNDVVDSDTEYTSNSNIILYEQYVQDNKEQVVQSDVSFVPNDALIMIINDVDEQVAQCVPTNKQNNAVNVSLTAELARYKELAEAYEQRAKFELSERELMIDTQMIMIIKDRNIKEESLQKELHSVKMQLNSTINHNKLIREEVSTLKLDFKQKENKLLKEFLDMKHL